MMYSRKKIRLYQKIFAIVMVLAMVFFTIALAF